MQRDDTGLSSLSLIKFFIDEHGCAKNQVDAELMIARLESSGFAFTKNPNEADIIIVNTCGFIESAKKESLASILSIKKNYENAKVVVTGCLAERYAKTLAEEISEIDAIFGNGDVNRIDEVISKLLKTKSQKNFQSTEKTIAKNCINENKNEKIILQTEQKGIAVGKRTQFLSFPGSAYVKITEGCSNHCSFCAIPLIRGELRSRKIADIVAEIKELVARGIYEINLIGQDIAAFGTGANDDVAGFGKSELPVILENGKNCGTSKKSALALLLEAISKLRGRFILRLLYQHPDHFNFDVLDVMKSDARLLPYFDIPFQSGDDEIIKKMNRRGSQKEYERLIKKIKNVFPDASIRTTFLVGFPSETEESFLNTKNFLKNIQSDWSGCFSYSKEENTAAFSMKQKVSKKIANARVLELQKEQEAITEKKLFSRIKKEYDVLIEEVIPTDDDEGLALSRAWFQAPDVDGAVVLRYDKTNKTQAKKIYAGNVVHVFAESVRGIDIEARVL